MKLLVVAVILGVSLASVLGEEKYTAKYDNFDLDKVISNDRLMKNYVDCCLDKGPCTPEGQELKSHIEDGLQTGCSKCTDKQKEGVKKVVHHLSKNKKDWWADIKQKFDPSGTYKEKYAEWISKEGIEA